MTSVAVDDLIRFSRIPLTVTSIIGNLAVLIVLLRYKSLRRNSSNMLIAQLSFAGLVLGIGLLIRSVQDSFKLAKKGDVYDRGACMLYGATTIFAMTLLQITLIMITLDRLAVLAFPLFYRRHVECVRISIARFLITLLASLTSLSGQLIGLPYSTDAPLCSSGATWTNGYRLYFMIFTSTSSLSTIVLNLATMALYCCKTQLSPQRNQNSFFITQTSIMLSYIAFWCIPSMAYLAAIILHIGAAIFGTITLALSIGSACFVSLNPLLFLWKNNEFRTFFFRFYRLRRNIKQTPVCVQAKPSTAAWSTAPIPVEHFIL